MGGGVLIHVQMDTLILSLSLSLSQEIGELGYDFGAQSVLPDDYEVLSDSAVERDR